MQNAMWLAAIFGPYLVIHGLWTIFYHDNMSKIWTSLSLSELISSWTT